MVWGEENDFDDAATRNRGRHMIKTGTVFGQTNNQPARAGRKRTGRSAGGWAEDTIGRY